MLFNNIYVGSDEMVTDPAIFISDVINFPLMDDIKKSTSKNET